jgi:hypothetical protein
MAGQLGFVASIKTAVIQPTDEPTIIAKFEKYFWLSTYQPFFDVDYSDVIARLKLALVPFNSTFNEITEQRPDMYGPIWLLNTLLLLLVVAANHSRHASNVEYDLELVSVAAVLLYSIALGVPLVLWSLITYFGGVTRYVKLACLYGYSLAVYLPVTAVCIMPAELLRWVVILLAMTLSVSFVLLNLHQELEQFAGTKKYMVMGTAAGAQVVLALSYKLYFFKFLYYADF